MFLSRLLRIRPLLENQTGRYLLYAAGETILIVLGILIALQIDSWNQDRQDQKAELSYMQSLIEDLEIDIEEADGVLAALRNHIDATQDLAEMLADPEVVSNSNEAYALWTNNMGFPDFLSNDRTLRQLKSDGGFSLIQTQRVTVSIIEYERLLKEFYGQQEICNQLLIQQGPYLQLFDTVAMAQTPTSPVPLTEAGKRGLSQAYTDRKLWMLALVGLVRRLEAVRSASAELATLIQTEYALLHPGL
ncbi:MAG: DUF6090 family protein [Pseudomonadota bacterium]